MPHKERMQASCAQRRKTVFVRCCRRCKALAGGAFWLLLWQLAAMLIDKPVIIVTPVRAFARLFELALTGELFIISANSFLKISAGFFLGFFGGIAAAAAAFKLSAARAVLSPLMAAVKSVPVASFIILALFWMKSSSLSVFIPSLTVLPIIYEAVLGGAENTDKGLIEAARIFRFDIYKRVRYLYLPSVMPFLSSACSAAAGLAFKSGAAAEVIGQPDLTLGDMLYRAKIYLETADLFAWTIAIMLLGKLFELLIRAALSAFYRRSQCVNKGGVCSDEA